MKKRIVPIIITVVTVLAIPYSAFADAEINVPVDEEITAEYSYASTVNSALTISNSGTAKSRAVITGLSGTTTKLSATMYLQKYSGGSWQTVQSWSSSTTQNSLIISKSKVVSHGKYRTHIVFKAYRNSNSERIIKNSGSVSY